jgi:WD40 repeat protein
MSGKKSNIPQIAILTGHSGMVLSIAFHRFIPIMATSGSDYTIKLWETRPPYLCMATLVGHRDSVNSIAFHPNAPLLVSGSNDDTLKIWDTNTHTCLTTKKAHNYRVSCVAFHPSEPLIASSGFIEAPKLWALSPDATQLTLVNDRWTKLSSRMHPSVNFIAFHPTDPLVATAGSDSRAMLWLILPNSTVQWLGEMNCVGTGRQRDVLSVAFHPSEPMIVTGGSDNNVKLWRIIKIDPSSSNLSADSQLRIECVSTLEGHGRYVDSVAFHPTAPIVVSGSSDKTMKLWRLDKSLHFCMATFSGNGNLVKSVAFHPNGKLLASVDSGNNVTLRDCSILTSIRQREMAIMRDGLTLNLQGKFFGTPQTHAQLDYKSRQKGRIFLGPYESIESAATLIARRINSRRPKTPIIAPISAVPSLLPLSSPSLTSLYATIPRRARSASPRQIIPSSPIRSRRARSLTRDDKNKYGGRSNRYHYIKHLTRKISKKTKTKRYRKSYNKLI